MITERARIILAVYSFVVCIFAVLPIAVVIIASFTETDFLTFPPKGFSLKWFSRILDRPEYIQAFAISLLIAACASLVAVVMGTMLAIAFFRFKFPGSVFLQTLFMAPLALPGLILGLALLQTALAFGANKLLVILFGHIVVVMPYVIRFALVALHGLPPNVELAASSLGASPLIAFRRIVLPLIRGGLLASFVFAFILSFDEVAIALFLSSGEQTTLPIRIFLHFEQSYDPLVASVSALTVLVAVIALVVVERTVGIGQLFGVRQ